MAETVVTESTLDERTPNEGRGGSERTAELIHAVCVFATAAPSSSEPLQ